MTPETIHLVFKTHLDIGFTDHAEAVRRQYHERFIPQALSTAEHFWRENPAEPAFIWTTGAWLIHDHLEQGSPAEVARLEEAIDKGLIRWHALPFTTHSELMSPALFRAGLSYAKDLDERFGTVTRAAKMTDVPGHTIGIVPLLSQAGVRFLHLGVNTACPVPDVPDLFRWRAPDGSEIVVMYQNSYGETQLPEGMTDALSFAHTNDNIGPQSVAQTVEVYRGLHAAHPGARLRAATLEEYGDRLWQRREDLPVVESEIGDSWIHGCASDPEKVARFRALQRLYDSFEAEGLTESRLRFGRALCMVPEHTWGVDAKTYLRDEAAWDRADFDAARANDYRFAYSEASWAEQRNYLDTAKQELDKTDLAATSSVEAELAVPVAIQHSVSGVQRLGGWSVAADPQTGGIARLSGAGGTEFVGRDGGPLFTFIHRSFDATDMARHMDTYLIDRPEWAILDHDKPGLASALTARSAAFRPSFTDLTRDGETLEISAEMPAEASERLGAPARIRWRICPSPGGLNLTLILEDKRANRMPEAGFAIFDPAITAGWELEKMGLWIDPSRCASRGGGALHAVTAARARGAGTNLSLTPLDAALCAPAGQDLMAFASAPPRWDNGLAFLHYTNKWGTNFPMWWSGSVASRFELRVEAD